MVRVLATKTRMTGSSITVAVRVRPLLSKEISTDSSTDTFSGVVSWNPDRVIKVVDTQALVFDPQDPNNTKSKHSHGSKRRKEIMYGFDRVFDETASQEDVFQGTTLPLIDDVMRGYNSTVFAYGATGCGKTHTITGTLQDPGIISRTMKALFDRIEKSQERNHVQVSVSYLEVYNETIWDLLVDPSNPPLDLREDETRVVVAGLSEHHPKTVSQIMQLLLKGNANRKKAPTAANAVSSRSHAVLQIHVRQTDRSAGTKSTIITGTLSIIDLAGSERASNTKNRGERLLEGANINRSLLALGNCINALCSDKPNYIPYRDSKLTRLLKYSLGGNCKVVMIANISPAAIHYEETHNTLKYANRAKNIKTKVTANETELVAHVALYPKIISQLRTEVTELRKQLDSSGSVLQNLDNIEPALCKAKKVLEKLEKARMEHLECNMLIHENEKKLSLFKSILVSASQTQSDESLTIPITSSIDFLHSSNATLTHNRDQFQISIERYVNQMEDLSGSSQLSGTERERLCFELSLLTNSMETRLMDIERQKSSQMNEQLYSWLLDAIKFSFNGKENQLQNLVQCIVGPISAPSHVDLEMKVFDDMTEASGSIADGESDDGLRDPIQCDAVLNSEPVKEPTAAVSDTPPAVETEMEEDSEATPVARKIHIKPMRPTDLKAMDPLSTPDCDATLSAGPMRVTPIRRDHRRRVRQSLIPVMKAATGHKVNRLQATGLLNSPVQQNEPCSIETPASPINDKTMLNVKFAASKNNPALHTRLKQIKAEEKENAPVTLNEMTPKRRQAKTVSETPSLSMSLRSRRVTNYMMSASKPPAGRATTARKPRTKK